MAGVILKDISKLMICSGIQILMRDSTNGILFGMLRNCSDFVLKIRSIRKGFVHGFFKKMSCMTDF